MWNADHQDSIPMMISPSLQLSYNSELCSESAATLIRGQKLAKTKNKWFHDLLTQIPHMDLNDSTNQKRTQGLL